MSPTFRRLAGAATTVLLLSATAACGSDSGGKGSSGGDGNDLETVKVMMFPGQAYRLPVVVAEQKGFFKDRGIELEIVDQPNGITGMQGMAATKAQVAHLSVSTVGQGWQAGNDFPFFCGGINVTQTTLVAATDSDLPSTEEGATWQEVLKALAGKKIGIQTPVGSGLQLLFAEALKEAGVKDVTYVNLGGTPTTTKAALENGSIDVAQINPPGTQVMAAENYGKPLVYLPEGPTVYKDYYGSGLVTTREWLKTNEKTAADFCEAVGEGLDFIVDPANAEASTTMLVKDTGITPAAATRVIETAYKDFSIELPEQKLKDTLAGYVKLGILKDMPEPTFAKLAVVPGS